MKLILYLHHLDSLRSLASISDWRRNRHQVHQFRFRLWQRIRTRSHWQHQRFRRHQRMRGVHVLWRRELLERVRSSVRQFCLRGTGRSGRRCAVGTRNRRHGETKNCVCSSFYLIIKQHNIIDFIKTNILWYYYSIKAKASDNPLLRLLHKSV